MDRSIYDIAKSRSGEWIRDKDCTTDDQKADIDECGGMVRWCPTCECFSSPNRPCFCGVMILQRKDNGLFWGGENGWVQDWKFHAEHFFSADSAKEVAKTMIADCGAISMYIVHTNWRNENAKEVISDEHKAK